MPLSDSFKGFTIYRQPFSGEVLPDSDFTFHSSTCVILLCPSYTIKPRPENARFTGWKETRESAVSSASLLAAGRAPWKGVPCCLPVSTPGKGQETESALPTALRSVLPVWQVASHGHWEQK